MTLVRLLHKKMKPVRQIYIVALFCTDFKILSKFWNLINVFSLPNYEHTVNISHVDIFLSKMKDISVSSVTFNFQIIIC